MEKNTLNEEGNTHQSSIGEIDLNTPFEMNAPIDSVISTIKIDWDGLHITHLQPHQDSTIVSATPDQDADYSLFFNTNWVFASKKELTDWLQETGRKHHMVVVVFKSDFSKGRTPRIWFGCDRSGKYVPQKKPKVLADGENRRKCGSKKCDCPLRLLAAKHSAGEDYWIIREVLCGRHNHPLSPYAERHPYQARLKPDDKELVVDLLKGSVKPKEVLQILKDEKPQNSSSRQTIYNEKKKYVLQERGQFTELQSSLVFANEAGYVVDDRRDPKTDVVEDLFFAHPDSIALARCFPYIFLMDCTYKTNVHKWPLFEIVGITSTLMTFSVCFVFMSQETMEHYQWALEHLRDLLYSHQTTLTFVTDREQALMNAIEVVFPNTDHLLCRWHIAMGIEKKGKMLLPKDGDDPDGAIKEKWRSDWKELVESDTLQVYEARLYKLQQEWLEYPGLYEYACETWLDLKEKFVSVWTNHIFHAGNISSNRVEGAHTYLKNSLNRSSRNTFLCLYRIINNGIEAQISEIKKSFTHSLYNLAHRHRISLFNHIKGSTSASAMELLRRAYDKYMSGHSSTPETCGCAMQKTHGLPCACMLGEFVRTSKPLSSTDLHPFWKKLTVQPMRLEFDDLELQEEYQWFYHEYVQANPIQRKHLLRRLREITRKWTSWLTTPPVPAKGKGRPKAKKGKKNDWSTRRDPSTFELPTQDMPTPPPGQFYSFGSGVGPSKITPSQNKKMSLDVEPIGIPLPKKRKHSTDYENYKEWVPDGWLPFVEDIENVSPDGNCGFRAFAKGMNMCDFGGWKEVRECCVAEIDTNSPFYVRMFGDDFMGQLRRRIDHYESPTLQSDKYWMLMPYTGYILANFFNVVIVYMNKSANMVFSYVPQLGSPPPQNDGAQPSFPVVCIMYTLAHFVCVRLSHFTPIPPPTPFCTKFNICNAVGWLKVLEVHTKAYERIFKEKFQTVDQTEVVIQYLSDSD